MDIKDIYYLIALAITIAGFVYRIRAIEDKNSRIMSALFHEQGGLNLTTLETCKCNRDVIFSAMRKHEDGVKELTRELHRLNENVLRIMVHLQIDTTNR